MYIEIIKIISWRQERKATVRNYDEIFRLVDDVLMMLWRKDDTEERRREF
jgi:hypothetical protein